MGPIAKLFSACLNMELECITQLYHWRVPTQTGFHRHHKLERLIILVDYLIAHAQRLKAPLAISFIDVEDASTSYIIDVFQITVELKLESQGLLEYRPAPMN